MGRDATVLSCDELLWVDDAPRFGRDELLWVAMHRFELR